MERKGWQVNEAKEIFWGKKSGSAGGKKQAKKDFGLGVMRGKRIFRIG